MKTIHLDAFPWRQRRSPDTIHRFVRRTFDNSMILLPNVTALFQQGSAIERCEVYKTDGDLSDSDGPHNRYVYLGPRLRLIASIWEKKFLGFESSAKR